MIPAMEEGFKINKAYADKYNIWRQKEELQKLKDRYGDENDSDDSSTSESEDEDAEALTEQLDKDWLRTLAALKSKDPKIYQKDVKFYHDDDNEETTKATGSKKSKDKPMYLKDYERKVLLEKGGIFNEEEELSQQEEPSTSVKSSLSYHQEQEELRKSIVAAAGDDSSSEDSDDNDTGLLKKRDKSVEEKTKEDFEYLEWLKGQKPSLEKDKEVGKDLAPLKNYWEKKDLDEGERFLKNYILNRQYIDNDDDESVPMYDDIVNDDDDENFSDEEELLVKQDSFERKYNFRFEEPDAAETKTFPRNFEESVRRKDTKRAEKRKETKERKKKEKEKKKEELKQLKKLKRQEILNKIEKLKEITGNKKLGFDENDLDEDFDPQKHDAMMETCFDDDYYDTGEAEEIKPVFEMSDEEGDWDNWKGGDNEAGTSAGGSEDPYANDEYYDDWNQQPDGEDPNFIMDADYDPEADRLRKKTKKEKKKKNKLAQALQTKKPVFDPNEKTFEEYFDEYYKLDYEDIIDDMPCRFKYRKVVPNNFGLTVDEIMKSRDKELNAWVSVKKMSQYRTEEEEMQDVRVFQNKGKNERKKKHILTSLFSGDRDKDEEPDIVSNLPHQQTDADDKSGKKKRKRRKGKKKQPSSDDCGGQTDNIPNSKGSVSGSNKAKATVNGGITNNSAGSELVDSPDKNTKSDEGGVKHGKKRKAEDSVEDLSVDSNTLDGEKKSNKKKKKKHRSDDSAEIKVDSEIVGDSEKGTSKKSENVVNSVNEEGESKNEERMKKNKKKKKNKNKGDRKLEMSEDRLKAYGINPKKYKYMKKEELFQIKPRKNKQVS